MKYREEMNQALLKAMDHDQKILVLGEGVTDPKGIFGTTLEATKLFPDRVIETPVSENMLTGACLGLALEGWKPIFVHARCDFVMLAMEHLVNTVPKWRSVHHGGALTLVMRVLIGRGWGQGPNHSQALHGMFAHVPGLRVLYPVLPANVSHWVDQALNCGSPTIMLEPRRLYEIEAIDYPDWEKPDVFIATFGDVVLEAAAAAKALDQSGIKAQVYPIEDVSAMPVPEGNVPTVVADTGHLFCGGAAELVARLAEGGCTKLKRVGPPFMPLPTSVVLEKEWYPETSDILAAVSDLLDIQPAPMIMSETSDGGFKGPF